MNGHSTLTPAQLARFKRLQAEFAYEGLWVGWADSDPDTAFDLIATDEGGNGEIPDDGDLIAYVRTGEGDPDELAAVYRIEVQADGGWSDSWEDTAEV